MRRVPLPTGRPLPLPTIALLAGLAGTGCTPASDVPPRGVAPASSSSSSAAAGREVAATGPGVSDPRALAIADEVIEAVGGRDAWEATRYVTWVNFGKRLQVWDKRTGDIRVQNDATTVLMNVGTREGRAWKFGSEITDPEELRRALEWAYEAFQLDRHEILLPFMLRDEGFRLAYLGKGEVEGRPTDILRVTFDEGAPYSRAEYRLHIDEESRLLVQWDYYVDRGDEKPRFYLTWSNYQEHGGILISDARGPEQHLEVHVFEELPASVFASPEPVPWLEPGG
jgi:hypothetical protein